MTGSGPIVHSEGYAALEQGNADLTIAQHFGVVTMTPTGNRTITTLTGAQLDAALPELKVGDTWRLVVINKAASSHSLTLTSGGDGVTIQAGTVAAATTGIFTFVKEAAASYYCA